MRLTQINRNLLQLTRLRLINCYLVREADGLTLIDTTIGGAADRILAAVATLGLPLRRILLTHAHGDHIGSLDALTGRYPTLEVLLSARDKRLLHKDLSLDPGEPQSRIRGSLPGARTQPTRLLQHGDTVGSLLCVSTPGHTPGHMCFFDQRDGTLFAGDALLTVGNRIAVVTDAPWFFPLPTLATWHKPTALVSVGDLLQAPLGAHLTRVAPGHGPVLPCNDNLLAAAVDRASKKLGTH